MEPNFVFTGGKLRVRGISSAFTLDGTLPDGLYPWVGLVWV